MSDRAIQAGQCKSRTSWRFLRRIALVLLALSVVVSVLANDQQEFDRGVAAYNNERFEEASRAFKPLAEKGDRASQRNLGLIYEHGRGVPQDDREAARWYQAAAKQGDPVAQQNTGNMYRQGRGVPQDDREAVRWYRAAAEQGFAESQVNLGTMYGDGKGVARNDIEAYAWTLLSAIGGNPVAIGNLQVYSNRMTKDQVSDAHRLATQRHHEIESRMAR